MRAERALFRLFSALLFERTPLHNQNKSRAFSSARQNKNRRKFATFYRQQSNDYALGNKAIRTMLSRKAIEDDFHHHPRMLLMLQQE